LCKYLQAFIAAEYWRNILSLLVVALVDITKAVQVALAVFVAQLMQLAAAAV
jgi:hypothetical protein